VVWVLLAGYMLMLSARQNKLSREVEMLKQQQSKK
jgi:CcmD family protein